MIPRFTEGNELNRLEFYRFLALAFLLLFAAACTSVPGLPSAEFTPLSGETVAHATAMPLSASAIPPVYPWTDESAVMNGLCFESVYDAAGRVFVIRSEAELNALYDLADNSGLCRRPVVRGSFDFSGGRLLVGLWNRSMGCTARHDVINIQRDDVAKIYAVTLRLIAQGGCNYELVRPFWIGLSDIADYDVRLLVQG